MRDILTPGLKHLNDSLLNKGFETMDWLTESEIDRIHAIVTNTNSNFDMDDVHLKTPFRLSAFNNSFEYKQRLFDEIFAVVEPKFNKLLNNYVPLVVNVFEKSPNDAYSAVAIHQNPSFVNEPELRTISVWIPLHDVSKENGTVGIMPYSQNKFYQVRAANMPDIFEDVADDLINRHFEPLVLKKGQIGLLDDSAIHWSYPNLTDKPRLAVQIISVPAEADHIYSYYNTRDGYNRMDQYAVTKEFFFKFNCKAEPEGLPFLKSFPYEYHNITKKELESACQPVASSVAV